jgi:peptidoglycan/LPS O-acetylase OafA/YrhL
VPYRPDVDGLRAFAVLAVIGFHAYPAYVPGGFVGVDVFFVISGFLITGLLLEALATNRFSFVEFYSRRARRILPALIVVLVAVVMIGWAVLVADEFRALQKHVLAAATFTSNVVLWQESGYFDAPADVKPLLHLWSLGIEEQFYLLWPAVLYIAWRRRWNLGTVIATIVALSFIANVRTVQMGLPAAAFFLPHNRLWQLLAGAWLAYIAQFHRAETDAWLRRRLYAVDGDPSNLLAWLGAALVVLAIVGLDRGPGYPNRWAGVGPLRAITMTLGLGSGDRYPGIAALVPTIGTMLLVWAGPTARLNRAVLSRRVMVWLGLISYPLYLWHWPLLAFLRITESGSPPAMLKVTAIVAALALAAMTYIVVERPIRARAATPRLAVTLVGTLAIIAAAGLIGWSPRVPTFALALEPTVVVPDLDAACHEQFTADGEYCRVWAPALPVTTALLGDSHAAHLLPAVGEALAAHRETVVHLGNSGCPPLLNIERFVGNQRDVCYETNASVLPVVAQHHELRHVVLSFRGAVDVTGTGYGFAEEGLSVTFRSAGTTLTREASMRQALADTVAYFQAHQKTVTLVLQVPELGFHITECLGRPFSFSRQVRRPCAVARADVLRRQATYRAIVDDVHRSFPTLRVVDPITYLCDATSCPALDGSIALYSDTNHLTRAGADRLVGAFR